MPKRKFAGRDKPKPKSIKARKVLSGERMAKRAGASRYAAPEHAGDASFCGRRRPADRVFAARCREARRARGGMQCVRGK